jgi:hypothetical protein
LRDSILIPQLVGVCRIITSERASAALYSARAPVMLPCANRTSPILMWIGARQSGEASENGNGAASKGTRRISVDRFDQTR